MILAKILFTLQPTLNAFQLIFLRSVWATLLILIATNKNTFTLVYRNVPHSQFGSLAYRSVQGATTNVINYVCARFLPLVVIGVVNNMSPLVTTFLCFLLLNENITKRDVGFLVLAFLMMVLIVVGGN
jgi:drug/metabolite transporter (DMT)-like permease